MENNLIQQFEYDFNHFKLDFKNQNINGIKEFKNWYKNTSIYIDKINKEKGLYSSHNNDDSLLIISFCNICNSYAICSFDYNYSFVNCKNCKTNFCIGCSRNNKNIDNGNSLCLRGYFKLLFVRTKYRRVGILFSSNNLNIFPSIICILFTPCYFGFISYIIGFNIHQNKKHNFHEYFIDYFLSFVIFSI